MSRMYSIAIASNAVTASVDVFELLAASGKPLVIHSIELEQTTEVGDAQEEGLALTLRRGVGSTSGSGGSSPTAAPQVSTDAAAGFTVETFNTTLMSAGTITTLRAWGWNVRIPFNKIFTPETAPVVAGGERIVLRLDTAPADSITMNLTVMVEELG